MKSGAEFASGLPHRSSSRQRPLRLGTGPAVGVLLAVLLASLGAVIAAPLAGPRPGPPQEAPTAAPSPLGAADRAFLRYAIEHNRVSSQAIELASVRAAEPALRALADRLLHGQQTLADRLLALFDAEPAPPAPELAPELQALRAAPAAEFDRRFLRLLLVSQREAVSRYRTAADDPALTPSVRQLARDAAPAVERQLDLALRTDRLLAELD
jgi:predicted outer membrane protein